MYKSLFITLIVFYNNLGRKEQRRFRPLRFIQNKPYSYIEGKFESKLQ